MKQERLIKRGKEWVDKILGLIIFAVYKRKEIDRMSGIKRLTGVSYSNMSIMQSLNFKYKQYRIKCRNYIDTFWKNINNNGRGKMKEIKKTKEERMKELCVDDEGSIVGEEDLEILVEELLEAEENKSKTFSYKQREFDEFENLELPEISSFKELKEYIDKLPKDKKFSISFCLKIKE